MNSSFPTYSFVIPAYNEAADIADTLESVWAQRYPAQEIIVVDDASTDETPDIVRDLKNRGRDVTLIAHEMNRGLAAARNTGALAAQGDVVVFLDADDQPPPDFLQRLTPLYSQGFDCVSVGARVSHRDVFGRYYQADHEVCYTGTRASKVGYTAAFSCRRDVALSVPFAEELPGAGGGEDVEFFEGLMRRGYSRAADFSIVVDLRLPTGLRGFWKHWVRRGRSKPYLCHFVKRRRMAVVVGRRVLVIGRTIVLVLTFAPAAVAAVRRARRSPRRLRDLPAFWLFYHLELVGPRIGELRSILEIFKSRRISTSQHPVSTLD